MKRLKNNYSTPNRGLTNVWCLVLTCIVLFVGTKIADGTFVNHINRMSENVDRALEKIIDDEKPVYVPFESNAIYYSDTTFNAKGMVGLYNLTKIFIDIVLPQDVLPPGEYCYYYLFDKQYL